MMAMAPGWLSLWLASFTGRSGTTPTSEVRLLRLSRLNDAPGLGHECHLILVQSSGEPDVYERVGLLELYSLTDRLLAEQIEAASTMSVVKII